MAAQVADGVPQLSAEVPRSIFTGERGNPFRISGRLEVACPQWRRTSIYSRLSGPRVLSAASKALLSSTGRARWWLALAAATSPATEGRCCCGTRLDGAHRHPAPLRRLLPRRPSPGTHRAHRRGAGPRTPGQVCARLRPSHMDPSAGAVDGVERIVQQLRRVWPLVPIVPRTASCFSRDTLMSCPGW